MATFSGMPENPRLYRKIFDRAFDTIAALTNYK
jgi:hypothetical protein